MNDTSFPSLLSKNVNDTSMSQGSHRLAQNQFQDPKCIFRDPVIVPSNV